MLFFTKKESVTPKHEAPMYIRHESLGGLLYSQTERKETVRCKLNLECLPHTSRENKNPGVNPWLILRDGVSL